MLRLTRRRGCLSESLPPYNPMTSPLGLGKRLCSSPSVPASAITRCAPASPHRTAGRDCSDLQANRDLCCTGPGPVLARSLGSPRECSMANTASKCHPQGRVARASFNERRSVACWCLSLERSSDTYATWVRGDECGSEGTGGSGIVADKAIHCHDGLRRVDSESHRS